MNISLISQSFYLNCVCIYFPKLFNQPTCSLIRKYIYKSLPIRSGLQYMNLMHGLDTEHENHAAISNFVQIFNFVLHV